MAEKVQGDPERALMSLIEECPMIKEYLKDAKRITTGEYGRIRTRKDYSYHNTKFWRPGMALIGDAAVLSSTRYFPPGYTWLRTAPCSSRGQLTASWRISLTRTARSASSNSATGASIAHSTKIRALCFYNIHVDENSYFLFG